MSPWIVFTVLAIVFNGTLAGASIDVALVKLPTRRRIGAVAYARFARGNDLGNGTWVYPSWAVLSALLVFTATALAFLGGAVVTARGLLMASSGASVLHFVATSRAAPIMLGIGKTTDDDRLLASKLDRFARWHALRTILQAAAFLLVLAALVAVLVAAG